MGFSRFGVSLAVRLFFLLLSLAAVGFLVITPGQHAATLLALALTISLTVGVFKFINRTNLEVARFLNAARYADFGHRFEFGKLGAGFPELGNTFTYILDRFREDRKQQESELRHLKALLEHVPAPLISIHSNEQITLWNNSARRLFGTAHMTRLSDLAQFGDEFFKHMKSIKPGERMLVPFRVHETDQKLTISASEITIDAATERLISLQNIQSELDSMQVSAWQDLVRVLTHEIMNSITPVASLAQTAVDLVDDVSNKVADKSAIVDELNDVKSAVRTVARRSEGLMNFVSNYRQMTQLPVPEKSRFLLSDLFADVTRVTTVDWLQKGLALLTNVEPGQLDLFADRQMVEQVLINLLQNSEHALEGATHGQIQLSGTLNRQGTVTIEVSDNGPGIQDEIASRIFVPFYTTRQEGSGVGLTLSRQIMLAHGGTISFANIVTKNNQTGARFSLVF
jgi:nitrogen fixation/metabolism regulation signal transduction histidine kinase